MYWTRFLSAILVSCWAWVPSLSAQEPNRPNVLFILVDDMGYGDLGCYGEARIETPHIDRLASEGMRFTQFYVASPICSPSRVAFTTGQFPSRHMVYGHFNSRRNHWERGQVDFLDPSLETVAKTFQQAGYYTAHVGKWHQGGGRDVGDAPLPVQYGFDQSLCSFEGLGDRILPPGGLSEQSAALERGEVTWVDKHEMTRMYVDRVIDGIQTAGEKPFYIHLWLNDVHDPHLPGEQALAANDEFANPFEQRFAAVLESMDGEIGRLLAFLDQSGLREDTLVILTSDNGPTAWTSYGRQGFDPPGSTGGFRGRKWSLYEGGIRMPFIARWSSRIPEGTVNDETIMGAVDYFPTVCRLAGLSPPEVEFDGQDMSAAFQGDVVERTAPLIWDYGRDDSYIQPARLLDRSPNLAIRDGRWKLLVNDDGSSLELYDFDASEREFENVAGRHPEIASRLSQQLLTWRRTLPVLDQGAEPNVGGNPNEQVFRADADVPTDRSPKLANAAWKAVVRFRPDGTEGVLLAQGGSRNGYALYLQDGELRFYASHSWGGDDACNTRTQGRGTGKRGWRTERRATDNIERE